MQFGDIGSFFDGKNGWSLQPGGSPTDMTESQKADAREGNARQLPNLLALALTPGVVSYEKKDGDNDVLLFNIPGGSPVHLTIDPKGQVVKRAFHGTTPAGAGDVVETLGDYRDVGGVKLAFKSSASVNGQKYMEVEITEQKANTNPDLSKLAAKPK
jgi:hypothetical protein